ncbi:hypothetical protein PHLGIDRAFT_424215 [Phlebiopsis gigantea 11061_1 CR5-6]|uniref:Uncharacterized protein n=1 Tax=Phlebiopsis gigantea (strain 11061_1 CR5-6) TaxID=745531 RepID=A0A0C3S8E8_PHLG1|nr:hypothetical protein PHLGIDRAFT_424215 [Phlebiopsis gigantea 11061_1 CR5-6]
MAPPSTSYPSGMHVSDSTKRLSTRPLDVLFFVGLGVISALISWFSVYLSIKIHVMLRHNPGLYGRAMGRWNPLLCCMQRRAGVAQVRLPVRENASIPEWTVSYEPFVQSPEPSAPSTPDEPFPGPRGLGIDFGDTDPSAKVESSSSLSLVPHLVTAEASNQQCHNSELDTVAESAQTANPY